MGLVAYLRSKTQTKIIYAVENLACFLKKSLWACAHVSFCALSRQAMEKDEGVTASNTTLKILCF